MSEGVHNHVSESQFWRRRWHYVVDALVASGAADIDIEEYERDKADLRRHGFSEPMAADLAFKLGTARYPSACEVNPW